MSIIAVIPVRMGSSRFPGKPLKKINGIPMVQRVINNCSKSKYINDIVTATCDQEIFDLIFKQRDAFENKFSSLKNFLYE